MKALQKLLVIGGYGVVGRQIAELALGAGAVAVRVAGRSASKAHAVAAKLGCEASAIDLRDPTSWNAALDGIDLVMVCVDQDGTAFAAHVLGRGIHYVDITASDGFLRSVEDLDPLCKSAGATAVLSVGFAPGLTNLLTQSCAARLDEAWEARIGILLGLGDTHGVAAIEWVLRKMFSSAPLQRERARMRFGNREEVRTVHALDFADQHIVCRTLALRNARTFMAFDSVPLTAWAFWLANRFAGVKLPWARLARWMARIRMGSDRCALAVEVSGRKNGKPTVISARFEGHKEASLTARVAYLVVEHLVQHGAPGGVHHIERLVDPQWIYAGLKAERGHPGPVFSA